MNKDSITFDVMHITFERFIRKMSWSHKIKQKIQSNKKFIDIGVEKSIIGWEETIDARNFSFAKIISHDRMVFYSTVR